MGRGRAKAKQQKVARELKYNSQFTDLDALQRELGATEPPAAPATKTTSRTRTTAGLTPAADRRLARSTGLVRQHRSAR